MSVVSEIRNKVAPIRRTGYISKTMLDVGYTAEENYLRKIIKQVVVGNDDCVKISSSIMVYGPPGSGKSQLVDKVLKLSEMEYGNNAFLTVRLEGAYCSSLQDSVMEMCHQMMEDGEDVDVTELIDLDDGTSFDERLEKIFFYINNKLIDRMESLVVVIDGMEKFVDDSNQRLLYNLFDISANAVFRVPICIIGITPCVDILDSFEKRVRSRFSHRQINLVSKVEFDQYQSWVSQLLTHSVNKEWNDQVHLVLADRNVIKILRLIYESDKCIGRLKKFVYTVMLHCDDKLDPSHFQEAYHQLFGGQSNVQMTLDLPICDIVVLLGIYKKVQRSQQAWQPAEAFEIVRKPYSLYKLRRDDFIKSVLKLNDMGLIVQIGSSKQTGNNVFESLFKCEISFMEFQDIWKAYPNLPSFFNEYL